MNLFDPIEKIKGIGEKTAEKFNKAGIYNANDLLHYFPRSYSVMPEISRISALQESSHNGIAVVDVTVLGAPNVFRKGGRSFLSFYAGDTTGRIRVYIFGMPYLKKSFPQGRHVILKGNVTRRGSELMMSQPKVLSKEDYECSKGKINAVYPVNRDLPGSVVEKAVHAVLPLTSDLKDYLPEETKKSERLIAVSDAIYKMHMPDSMEDVYSARKRLAFDEFFLFFSRMHFLKTGTEKETSEYSFKDDGAIDRFIGKLPYKLTGAQSRALSDIERDITSGYAANRLIQGDVGSGKTVIAFAAALAAVSNGYQALIMAPTEVLAAQHYKDIVQMTEAYSLPFRPGLLTGSLKASEKKKVKAGLASGDINLIIGTHALIQDDVEFKELALVVTDEQHRFGVGQRMKAVTKGASPHTFVMSATPIPRTLGLILYGDMDVSVIDELPGDRIERKNAVVDPAYRQKAYQMIVKHVRDGEQAYIICPMVESNDEEAFFDPQQSGNAGAETILQNVTDYTEELKEKLPSDIRIEALHGRMKPKEKNEIMERFAAHETDVLVSTTVVEVGVNVPNATIMLIENAERFGLSALHQLRGRIGRGNKQSYCIFMTGAPMNDMSKHSKERLNVLKTTNDGFKIAEEDLKLRGPGDFFGLRQSGLPYFKIADIYEDAELLKRTRSVLEHILNDDPEALNDLKEALRQKEDLSFTDFHGICL